MIHHVSLPARDPLHVAGILAEMLGGRAFRFPGPLADAAMAVSGDPHGTMIEVYPDTVIMMPGEGDAPVSYAQSPADRQFVPFHVMLSTPLEHAEIEAIGIRAGWRTKLFGRAAPGLPPAFNVIEVWVENRTLIEVVPGSMIGVYEDYMQLERLDALGLAL
ncbi:MULTISPECIES: hypothetical protein [Methylococcus]|jgi:hypothetical protein|uniref:Uncharacterized protein n=1 Tax=Methylococcus capsulatus TaxID=414 RepID=A0AA35V1Z8_METCP|nr:hypothetical protein [Methylococcus capsulatus]QXP90163.1 hypothetical protein KW114_14065 [Methylococcus capsulatus]CAI8749825.1 conserved protein of unknown function [Methylococcus capsulatus]